MAKRFVSIWFRHLVTDWLTLKRPALQHLPFVFALADHGRMLVTAANGLAQTQGVYNGMAVADARAIIPALQVFDDQPGRAEKLLQALAEWCIRYTPVAAADVPDGLILDVSGCAHLWGGELLYLTEINTRLKKSGYQVRAAMADTIGAARAQARFGRVHAIIPTGAQATALLTLPPAALRLPPEMLVKMQKFGFHQLRNFMHLPRPALRRRFGDLLLLKLDQALGREEEPIQPVQPIAGYQERLPCPEPIVTATGIEIALNKLLATLCRRLQQEEKGLRTAAFTGYRMDAKTEQVTIGTNHASCNEKHLFTLFENKLTSIAPEPGIELFTLEALTVEDLPAWQQKLWTGCGGTENKSIAELLDRVANRVGSGCIHRYLPDEHYWPERSVKAADNLQQKPVIAWPSDRPRPTQLLARPEPVEVTAPVPDYPPMNFRYKGILHTIKKADGPERIEREWWIDEGPHRDYYYVEDEEGQRYWLFRSGHYTTDKTQQWFMHGFFA